MGAIIGAVIVLLYCFAGGLRASIWTDAAQSFVMIFSMILLCVVSIIHIGGIGQTLTELNNVTTNYMSLWPSLIPFQESFIGAFLFVLGCFFAGVGVVGQPHIMVRFMSMDSPKNMQKARIYYYTWYSLFSVFTIFTALCARLILPESADFDAELALPSLAQALLPEFFIGLILAGLFAATISTADSQIISCTSSISHDFLPKKYRGYAANKISTILITFIALGIALSGNKSVFTLVVVAWSALASAFAPMVILYALKQELNERTALCMLVGGLTAMLSWRYYNLSDIAYEIAPGIITGFIIYSLSKALKLNRYSPSLSKKN